MFFVVSKIAGFLTTPTSLSVGLITVGVLLLWTRWRKAGRGIATAGAVLLFALAFLPLPAILVANQSLGTTSAWKWAWVLSRRFSVSRLMAPKMRLVPPPGKANSMDTSSPSTRLKSMALAGSATRSSS